MVLLGTIFHALQKSRKFTKGVRSMPNHVINEITLHGSEEEIQAVLKAVQKDSLGIGTIDFNKLLPMPPELNIEAGSRTDRGLKHYRDFVEVFTLGGTVNTEKLASIPPESEAAFLRQRPDIPPDEWELGKAAWNNIRRFGAPTWYEWCIGHRGQQAVGAICLFVCSAIGQPDAHLAGRWFDFPAKRAAGDCVSYPCALHD